MDWFRNVGRRLEVPHGSQWINDDLRPLEARRRTWSFITIHNFWLSDNCSIGAFLTGSALIPLGLNWWQAIIVTVIGNLIATGFFILGSLHGIFYHIGFSVSNRAVWGIWGAYFPIWNRIFLCLVWYGFQSFVGGQCFEVMLLSWDPDLEKHIPNTIPASTGMTSAEFVSYFVFCIICLPFLLIKPHRLGKIYAIASSVAIIFFLALLIWALATMGHDGFGDTLDSSSSAAPGHGPQSLGWLFVYGMISTVGGSAAGILNQNDYARLAKSPKHAFWGYAVPLPFWNIFSAIVGILTVAATQKRYGGDALWNPPDLLARILKEDPSSGTRAAVFFAGLALCISQVVLNVPGNALVGGLDLASIWPKYISIRRGGLIVALLSPIVNPWRLVNTATVFLNVVSGYGTFLAPMTGLMVSHYFLIAKGKFHVDDLYRGNSSSMYWYTKGFNWRAPIAWVVGVAPCVPGLVATANHSVHISDGALELFYLNYLYGFFSSALVFTLLHRFFPDKESAAFANNAMTACEVQELYQDLWEGNLEQTTRGFEERELTAETASDRSDGPNKLVGQYGHLGHSTATSSMV